MEINKRRKIFVDFEWHPISYKHEKQREIATNEIIEFGAVMLDSSNQEIGSFKSYVKPQYVSKITKHIEKLTGISYDLLADAPDFASVLPDFISWCEKGHGNYEIYSWSNSDLIQMKKEIALKGICVDEHVEYMTANWFDLQGEFDVALGFERQLSLADALFAAGIDAVGTAHDALDDARNASTLFHFLTDPEKQRTTILKIRSVLVPEKKGQTLGDMFDWSQIKVSSD